MISRGCSGESEGTRMTKPGSCNTCAYRIRMKRAEPCCWCENNKGWPMVSRWREVPWGWRWLWRVLDWLREVEEAGEKEGR